MSFLELARKRRSVRKYKNTPVDDALVLPLLEAARIAPSAANRQPCRIIVIRSAEQKKKLAAAYERPWFLAAPLIIVVCADTSASWVRAMDNAPSWQIDAAIAMDHITLAAADAGLGTCWIGAFNPAEARLALQLPKHIEPVVMTPLGYPDEAETTTPKERKKMEEIVFWEAFGTPHK